MEKIAWIFPDLEGEYVETHDGMKFSIEELANVSRARLRSEDGTVRLVRPEEAVRGYVRMLKQKDTSPPHQSLSLDMKHFIFRFVQRQEEMRSQLNELRRTAMKAKRQLVEVEQKVEQHRMQQEQNGEMLYERKSNDTLPTLLAKAITVKNQKEKADQELREKEEEQNRSLKTHADIVAFFKEQFDVSITRRTLIRWARKGSVSGPTGRAPAFSEAAERRLLQIVLWMDKRGFPLCRSRIRTLALELAEDPATQARFSKDGPTESWFAGWLKRAKQWNPELSEVIRRGSSRATPQWSENVNFWFDSVKSQLIELGLAREPRAGEIGELIWHHPGRVLVTEEICVSGDCTRKVASNWQRVRTTTESIEQGVRGSKYRRVADSVDITQERITLLAGHDLTGLMTVPVWIFTAENDISGPSKKEVEAVAPKYPDYLAANQQHITDVTLSISPKGANITDIILRAIKRMYPDVAPVPEKRVCWFTNLHESRLSYNLINTLGEHGIHLFGWLSNTASKSQSHDVEPFGTFKARRDFLEDAWIVRNPGKKVDCVAKVEIAGTALIEIFTTKRIMEGCRKTGLLPFSRTPLLEHPCILNGNEIKKTRVGEALRTLQTPPPSSSISVSRTSSPTALELSPQLSPKEATPIETPERNELCESTFTSISQREPNVSNYQTLCDQIDSDESFRRAKQSLLEALRCRIDICEMDQKIYLQSAKEKAKKEKESLAKAMDHYIKMMNLLVKELVDFTNTRRDEIDRWFDDVCSKHQQELHHLNFWKEKVEGMEIDQKLAMCTFAEKLDVLKEAQRDEFGLAVSDAGWLGQPPELHPIDGVTLGPFLELLAGTQKRIQKYANAESLKRSRERW